MVCGWGASRRAGDALARVISIRRRMHRRNVGVVFHRLQNLARRRGFLLLVPHRRILSAAREQFAVPAALDDLAMVEHQNLVGIDHGRQPMGDDERGAAAGTAGECALDFPFGAGVERAVASSSSRIGGFFRMVRAMATRCFSPPDNFSPRSPTMVS